MQGRILGVMVLCAMASNVYALDNGKGIQMSPTLSVTEKYDDNVASTETNKTSSFITIIAPSLEAKVGDDTHNASASYTYEKGSFSSSKDDDYTDSFADLIYHNGALSKQTFDAGISYSKSHDPRGSVPGVTSGSTPNLWNETVYNLGYVYGKKGSAKLSLEGSITKKRYDTLGLSRLDTDVENITTTFLAPVGAKTSMLFEVVFAKYDYKDITTKLDSNERTFYTGLTWEATAKTTGTVKVGKQQKNFVDPVQGSSSFFSWDISLGWSPLSYSTWDFGTSLKSSESDGISGFIKSKNTNVAWTHEWSERLKHKASIDLTDKTYSYAAGRSDTDTKVSVSFNYDFNTWLNIETSYNRTKLESTIVGTNYVKNEVAVIFLGKL